MLPSISWKDDFNDHRPIYLQIIDRFYRSLVRGEIAPGDRIPSIRELAVDLKVNANTIQRAYQEMERGALIFSQRGTGYFVTNDNKTADRVKNMLLANAVETFLSEMRSIGLSDEEITDALGSHIREGEGGNDTADSKRA